MQIVIDIPEEDYIRLRDEGMFGNVTTFKRAVREGIPLAEQEPCEDCVSRQDACSSRICRGIDCIDCPFNKFFPDGTTTCLMAERINDLPPVTPTEKVGQWEYVRYEGFCGNWHCSECRTIVPHMPEEKDNTPIYKWCPMCGAKMQEVKNNEIDN